MRSIEHRFDSMPDLDLDLEADMGTITAGPVTSSIPARPRLRVIPGGSGLDVEVAGVASARRRRDGEGSVRAGVSPWVAGSTRPVAGRRGAGSAGGAVGGRDRGSAGGAARGRQVGRPRLRLTRRGRIVVRVGLLALAALAMLLLVLALSHPASAGNRRHAVPVRYHVVLPGETLWGIAGEVAPDVDRRETITRIVEMNALPGSGVAAGQRIALPESS